jgi:hypothetical protein
MERVLLYAAVIVSVAFLSLWMGNPARLSIRPVSIFYVTILIAWFTWKAVAICCPECNASLAWFAMTHGRPPMLIGELS